MADNERAGREAVAYAVSTTDGVSGLSEEQLRRRVAAAFAAGWDVGVGSLREGCAEEAASREKAIEVLAGQADDWQERAEKAEAAQERCVDELAAQGAELVEALRAKEAAEAEVEARNLLGIAKDAAEVFKQERDAARAALETVRRELDDTKAALAVARRDATELQVTSANYAASVSGREAIEECARRLEAIDVEQTLTTHDAAGMGMSYGDGYEDGKGDAIEACRDALRALLGAETVKPAGLPLRREVAAFAQLMERKLRESDHKGGWKQCDMPYLWARLDEEKRELAEVSRLVAIKDRRLSATPKNVGREAADVANFAMMIADVCGALGAETAGARVGDDSLETIDIARLPWHCDDCGREHRGAALANICIGCSCPRTAPQGAETVQP